MAFQTSSVLCMQKVQNHSLNSLRAELVKLQNNPPQLKPKETGKVFSHSSFPHNAFGLNTKTESKQTTPRSTIFQVKRQLAIFSHAKWGFQTTFFFFFSSSPKVYFAAIAQPDVEQHQRSRMLKLTHAHSAFYHSPAALVKKPQICSGSFLEFCLRNTEGTHVVRLQADRTLEYLGSTPPLNATHKPK